MRAFKWTPGDPVKVKRNGAGKLGCCCGGCACVEPYASYDYLTIAHPLACENDRSDCVSPCMQCGKWYGDFSPVDLGTTATACEWQGFGSGVSVNIFCSAGTWILQMDANQSSATYVLEGSTTGPVGTYSFLASDGCIHADSGFSATIVVSGP